MKSIKKNNNNNEIQTKELENSIIELLASSLFQLIIRGDVSIDDAESSSSRINATSNDIGYESDDDKENQQPQIKRRKIDHHHHLQQQQQQQIFSWSYLIEKLNPVNYNSNNNNNNNKSKSIETRLGNFLSGIKHL